MTYNIDGNKEIIITENGVYNLNYLKNSILKIVINPFLSVTINEFYNTDVTIKLIIDINDHSVVNYNTFNLLCINKSLIINLNEHSQLINYSLELGYNSNIDYEFNLLKRKSKINFTLVNYSDKNIFNSYNIKTNHLTKETDAVIMNYGALNNASKIDFNVQNYIKKGCKKSNTYQKTKILLLSDNPITNVNPILLIDEFDVTAGHAATVSKINEQEIYYLQTKGLTKDEAQKVITLGYLLEKAPTDKKEELEQMIEKRMNNEL